VGQIGPLLTVREPGTAILGKGGKPQVYEKAGREVLRKAIELAGGVARAWLRAAACGRLRA
jgi:protein involved in polysaccharide export with SLBB domain